MATNNNSKHAAELRIGTVKASVLENEVGGITDRNVSFSRIYPEGGQWKTTQSFRFVNLLSVAKLADQAHTLIAELKTHQVSKWVSGDRRFTPREKELLRRRREPSLRKTSLSLPRQNRP